jgi:hypothetical protein
MRLSTRLLLACRRDLRRTRAHMHRHLLDDRLYPWQTEQGRIDRLYRAVDWLRGRLGEWLSSAFSLDLYPQPGRFPEGFRSGAKKGGRGDAPGWEINFILVVKLHGDAPE